MSWEDGTCPWGYTGSYVDMMPTCVYNGGLADLPPIVPLIGIDRPAGVTYPADQIPTRPIEGPSLFGYAVSPTGVTDYHWLMYAGIGVAVLLLLGGLKKGRR